MNGKECEVSNTHLLAVQSPIQPSGNLDARLHAEALHEEREDEVDQEREHARVEHQLRPPKKRKKESHRQSVTFSMQHARVEHQLHSPKIPHAMRHSVQHAVHV